MIRYTSLESALPLVSRAVRRQLNKTEMLAWAYDGYEQLQIPGETEPVVQLFEVKDHKVKLPMEVKEINLVTYLLNDPSEEELKELETCNLTEEEIEGSCVGRYILAHKVFLESSYYNNNFFPLKYIGNAPYLCENCFNRFCHQCNETFSVDHNKILWTSFKEGSICVEYERDILDTEGYPKIVDIPEVKRYLAFYIEYEHWRNRSGESDVGANREVNNALSLMNIWYNKARGSVLLHQVDRRTISELTLNDFNARFFKMLPDNYRRKYEIGGYGYN